MTSREGKLSYKRRVLRFENISSHTRPIDWVRPIANDHSLSQSARRSHAVRERVDKRVDATTNVLHVKEQNVDVVEHRVSRLSCLAVERMDRQSRLSIDTVSALDHVVLHVAADSMLRSKQGAQLDTLVQVQKVRSVMKRMVDRCLVAD